MSSLELLKLLRDYINDEEAYYESKENTNTYQEAYLNGLNRAYQVIRREVEEQIEKESIQYEI